MRLQKTLSAVLLLISASALAEPPERKPWQWTPKERFALRLDPHAAAERARVHASTNAGGNATPAHFVIDGRRNHELFLPSELMSFLLSSIYIVDSASAA